jgi:hypothetical protein
MKWTGWGGLRIEGQAAWYWWPLLVILAIVLPPLVVFLFFGTVLSPPALGFLVARSGRVFASSSSSVSSFRGPPFSV